VRRRLDSRSEWQFALATTVALRLFYSAAAAIAAAILPPRTDLVASNALTAHLPAASGLHYAFIGIWERFDTLWYLRIAERGYDLPAAVVFYPLYPALIRSLSWVVEPALAALTISTAASFLYFCGLQRLARQELSETLAFRAVALAMVWPASFFLFAGYTEAVTAALIVWCIVFARNEHWLSATTCAFAAGLTRSAGTLLIVPLLIMAWRARAKRGTSQIWPVAVAPFGTFAYWFWLRRTGRPSIVEAYRTYWSTQVLPPWTTLWRAIDSLGHRFQPLVLISFIALAVFLVAGVIARRRTEDRWFSLAVIAHILLRACSPPLLGAPRYLLPVYPAYVTFAQWTGRLTRSRFTLLCAVLFALNLGFFWLFLGWSLVL